MASIFTYDPNPPRVSSPWSTPGTLTPQRTISSSQPVQTGASTNGNAILATHLEALAISKLEPEPQEGPTEYKLHLLLRPRRSFLTSTTAHLLSGSQHSRSRSYTSASPRQSPALGAARPANSHVTLHRQNRIQQLTTQLLWRLQQSSPFHSSSSSQDLIIPVLPEVTAHAGAYAPHKPARLLPGLEESQGALYEIGVSDDGYFIGLTEDEMNESLSNLKAMAASLGCDVEVRKMVVVGSCEWVDLVSRKSEGEDIERRNSAKLLVAEALVRPDLHPNDTISRSLSQGQLPFNAESYVLPDQQGETESDIEQLRLSLVGPSASGKSSLLGTLTSSVLDNGRGKSRLGLLKHRHEISSGITSSVAQDVIGYASISRIPDPSVSLNVINYATGDVTTWNDIHNLIPNHGRLAFVSDSPGLPRYSKSILRTLLSWNPHWAVLCIAADEDEDSMSKTYLELCMNLEIPLAIAITKVDKASKQGLKQTLARLLSISKATGSRPAILAKGADLRQAEAVLAADLQHISTHDATKAQALFSRPDAPAAETIPIVLTSAVSGMGITQLHALISELPVPVNLSISQEPPLFLIDEVYTMPASKVYSQTPTESPTGTILCGHLLSGRISTGESFLLGPFSSEPDNSGPENQLYHLFTILSLRNLRLPVRTLLPGQVGTIGVEALASRSSSVLKPRKGMILTSPGSHPTAYAGFTATFSSTIFADTDSSPLILGGNALAYFHSVRAPVKVTSVAFMDFDSLSTPSSAVAHSPNEAEGVFSFDDEKKHGDMVKISFEFLGGVEWLKTGQKVLIMPNVTASYEADAGSGVGAKGLVGFVGKVCECG